MFLTKINGNLPNMDLETGIRYGVISIHSLADGVLGDIMTNGENLTYEEARSEFEKETRRRYFGRNADKAEELLEEWNEFYESSEDTYRYESDGVTVQTSGESNLWVFMSPTIVKARLCSPCYPNAGDLDTLDPENGYETYGLPADWLRETPEKAHRAETP